MASDNHNSSGARAFRQIGPAAIVDPAPEQNLRKLSDKKPSHLARPKEVTQ
jgi:hypothetical protein